MIIPKRPTASTGRLPRPGRRPPPEFSSGRPRLPPFLGTHYDAVTQVDYRTGEVLEALKKDGLSNDTIVIVWADHGVGMPRGKHTVWEQGTHDH